VQIEVFVEFSDQDNLANFVLVMLYMGLFLVDGVCEVPYGDDYSSLAFRDYLRLSNAYHSCLLVIFLIFRLRLLKL